LDRPLDGFGFLAHFHGSGEMDFALAVAGVGPGGFDFAFAGHGDSTGDLGGHSMLVLLDVADLAVSAVCGWLRAVVLVDLGLSDADLCCVGPA